MTTLTVSARLDARTIKKLEQLSKATSRSKSFLAAEAIQAYVEEQAWQIEAIEEGIRQADAGNFASGKEVKKAFAKWGVDAG
jgi:RHH-type rel operon transcriptional repressor/antitoxin RelB